jgi:predicted phosphohydrolase
MLRGNHDYWWSSISKVRRALPERMQALQHDAFAWDVTNCQPAHLPNVLATVNLATVNLATVNLAAINAPAGVTSAQTSDQHRVIVAGTRGWDCPGSRQFDEHDAKIYARERQRLELSLQHAAKLAQGAASSTLIVMLHYPPSNLHAEPSAFTELLNHYQADIVVYGHLHGYDPSALQPPITGAQLHLVAADALGFAPQLLLECDP